MCEFVDESDYVYAENTIEIQEPDSRIERAIVQMDDCSFFRYQAIKKCV